MSEIRGGGPPGFYARIAKPLLSVATFALLFGALGIAELFARAYWPAPPGDDPMQDRFHLWLNGPCYKATLTSLGNKLERVPNPVHRETQGAPIHRHKSLGVRRVAVVGESSASVFEHELGATLDGERCDPRLEVLPCSTPGANLALVERRFDEVLGYEPDLVVVVFGHNLYFDLPTDPSLLRLKLLARSSRLLSHFAPAALAPDSLPRQGSVEQLAATLRRFGEQAKARGIALMLSTMASNLWLTPRASDEERADPGLLEARYLHEIGRLDEAITRLRQAIAARGTVAIWHYTLAEWLRERRMFAEVFDELDAAKNLDSARFRASRAVNDTIRMVAHEGGFMLRDTEATLRTHAPHGIPGWESFWDNCHLLPATQTGEILELMPALAGGGRCELTEKLAGRTLERPPTLARLDWVLAQAGAAGGVNASSWLSNIPEIVRVAIEQDGDAGAATMERRLAGGNGATAETRLLAAEGLDRAGRRADAVALCEKVLSEAPSDQAWVERALLHLRVGETAAARAALGKALALRPERADARYFLDRLEGVRARVGVGGTPLRR